MFLAGRTKTRLEAVAPATDPGQRSPAVAWFSWDPDRGVFKPGALEVLELEGERLKQIAAFVNPALFPLLRPPGRAAAIGLGR